MATPGVKLDWKYCTGSVLLFLYHQEKLEQVQMFALSERRALEFKRVAAAFYRTVKANTPEL